MSLTPPLAVREAARRGLEARRSANPSQRGGLTARQASQMGIGSGVVRAQTLASGRNVSPETVKRMHAFFSRHRRNKDTPRGRIAWDLWGGDPGAKWAAEQVALMKKTASSGGGTGTAGGLSSATGLSAPNAGQVGSAPTRDPRRPQGDVISVTKNASWDAGVHTGIEKFAYGTNSSVGPTTDRDGAQTMGEVGVEQGSSEITGQRDYAGRTGTKITRGSGNQGPRGVPEWLRVMKHLHSPATWTGGDKSGPQKSDNQFEAPGAGGRP